MKKLLAILLGLLLTFAAAVPASAAGLSVTVASSPTHPVQGQNVTFTVSLSGAAKATSGSVAVTYSADLFEFVSGAFSKAGDASLKNYDPGTKKGVLAFETETDLNGAYFVLVLRAKTYTDGLRNVSFAVELKNGRATVGSGAAEAAVWIECAKHTYPYDSYAKQDEKNHIRICKACGHVETSPHTWNAGAVTKAATCKDAGAKTYTCTAAGCGATKTETVAKTNNHSFGSWSRTKAPTCTVKGQETRTCSICGKTETRDVAATGHSFGGWTTTKEATCEGKGEQTRTCSKCGVKETGEIAALGHSFQNPTVTKQPTCTEPGEESGKCTRCGRQTTAALPATGHRYGDPVVVTPATETAAGKQTKTCTVCGNVIEEEIPMLGTVASSTPDTSEPDASEPADVDSSDVPADANPSDDGQGGGAGLWWIWLIVAAVVIGGGISVSSFVKKNKQEIQE